MKNLVVGFGLWLVTSASVVSGCGIPQGEGCRALQVESETNDNCGFAEDEQGPDDVCWKSTGDFATSCDCGCRIALDLCKADAGLDLCPLDAG